MSIKAIRLPSPDLITPFATKKAARMRSIKLSENPEKATLGVSTLNKTTATSARIEAVKIDRASIRTPNMAVIKIVNRCQVSGVRSQGTGKYQMIKPNIRVMILLIHLVF